MDLKLKIKAFHKLLHFLLLIQDVKIHILYNTDLIGVQLALVHWVGVFNDFYLVLSKPLAIETLGGMK